MSWKSFIQFSITLLFGFSIGFAFSHSGPRHGPPDFDGPGDRGRHFLERFAEQLDLNDEQKAKAKEILETQRQEMDKLRDETFPKFEEIKKGTREQIRALLNQEQVKEFDKLHQELESKRKRLFPGRHHHRGPPGHRRGGKLGRGKHNGGGKHSGLKHHSGRKHYSGGKLGGGAHEQGQHEDLEYPPPPPAPPPRGEIPIF